MKFLAFALVLVAVVSADRNEDLYKEGFKLLNVDGSENGLSADEIQPLLKVVKPDITLEEVTTLIQAQGDKDKFISLPEFLKIVQTSYSECEGGLMEHLGLEEHKKDDHLSGKEFLQLLLKADLGKTNEAKNTRVIFELANEDGDAHLTREELEKICPEQAEALLKLDDDEKITFEELEKIFTTEEGKTVKVALVKHFSEKKF